MEIEIGCTIGEAVECPICIGYNATCLRVQLSLYKEDEAAIYLYKKSMQPLRRESEIGIMKVEEKIPIKSPDTAHQIIDGEAVIITPGQMMVHVLNRVGSRIWDLADGERNIEDIAKILAEEFDVSYQTALQDAAEFTSDLAEKEIMDFAQYGQDNQEG